MQEEFLDVLQNIEQAIVSVYRDHRDLTDFQVDSALEALGRTYQREKMGGVPVLPKNSLSLAVYESMKMMCDWRLGRENMVDEEGAPMQAGLAALTIDEILVCLKKLRKSVSFWNKGGGTRGYLEYISQFLPK